MISDDLKFKLHCLNRDCTNMALLKYRDFQGFMVTGQHSGTHWIKWMLSHAMARHYEVPPPKYYDNQSSNDLIGHPKHERMYPDLPRIASSHSTPSYPMQWSLVRDNLDFPKYVLVVRDLRDALISNYEKWKHKYNVSFTEYLKGDPRGKKYILDSWGYVHFLNRWGDVMTHYPKDTIVLRYEDFKADKETALTQIAAHFELPLTAEDIVAGAKAGSKEFMLQHRDPNVDALAVRKDGEGATYSEEDKKILQEILDNHLRHDFGYDYFTAPRGFQIVKEKEEKKAA